MDDVICFMAILDTMSSAGQHHSIASLKFIAFSIYAIPIATTTSIHYCRPALHYVTLNGNGSETFSGNANQATGAHCIKRWVKLDSGELCVLHERIDLPLHGTLHPPVSR